MNLKYLHFNHNFNSVKRQTFCYISPHKETILTTVNSFLTIGHDTIKFSLGSALVHPNDRYIKRVGREESFKKLKLQDFTIDSINVTYTHINIHLNPINDVNLTLRYNRLTERSYLVFNHERY